MQIPPPKNPHSTRRFWDPTRENSSTTQIWPHRSCLALPSFTVARPYTYIPVQQQQPAEAAADGNYIIDGRLRDGPRITDRTGDNLCRSNGNRATCPSRRRPQTKRRRIPVFGDQLFCIIRTLALLCTYRKCLRKHIHHGLLWVSLCLCAHTIFTCIDMYRAQRCIAISHIDPQ